MKMVVCGAGGYIGSRLVGNLLDRGYKDIRAVSSRPVDTWLKSYPGVENCSLDLRELANCEAAIKGAAVVYNLAASVGGIGFVEANRVNGMLACLINANLLRAATREQLLNYFFASSSCVYPEGNGAPLKESDAYPADPVDGYGWEKLFSERMCLAFAAERSIPVSIARLHGVYGPGDIRPHGKDHVVTALCRKFVAAKLSGQHEINIWGDGNQVRSLIYIDDVIEGITRLSGNAIRGPVNLANSRPVSVNQIVDALEEISGITPKRFYSANAPTGRAHKVSDNTLLRDYLAWEPMTPLAVGLRKTYNDMWERELMGKQ